MKEAIRAAGWAAALRVVLAAVLVCPVRASAVSVVPVGRAVGIKLFSDGVVVVGTADIVTEQGNRNPAKACGLREGDVITHINATEVDTIEEVTALLQQLEGSTMSISALRGEEELELTARAVKCATDGAYKLGAWIRDSMAGIGTVTFYCPETGLFGALGHGINDVDTALLMPLESGSILPASVSGVRRGESGKPGQLKGVFDTSVTLGELAGNSSCGVFGRAAGTEWAAGTPMETAKREEIRAGQATILSNIAGTEVGEYDIRILKVYPAGNGENRDFLIEVTDPALLAATGGIVQGMSGSPIIQNGKLVGAVTHVLVDDPTRGYGIFIENMLDAAA